MHKSYKREEKMCPPLSMSVEVLTGSDTVKLEKELHEAELLG